MKAQIYLNRHIIAANKKASKKTGELVDNPAISVNTYKGSIYAKEVEFTDSAKLIQDSSRARCSGATIWIESEFESLIIDGVRANRFMFERQKDLNLEDYFWQFASDAAWDKNHDYEAIAQNLSPKYGADQNALLIMFRELQKRIMKKLDHIQLDVSDDGFDDLTAHIIGMGKESYYSVLNNPALALTYSNSYVESFVYVLLGLKT